EGLFNSALDLARQQGARAWELRAAISLTRLWQRRGRVGPASGLLASVVQQFTDRSATADMRDAQELLVQVAPIDNGLPPANRLRQTA
ncbi:MAG TPA: hypothetical protein VH206_03690, partial [Xanthobacteraceae bacterium]|nr:hypothetical protein [Xanthobacteraceae bacterium]